MAPHTIPFPRRAALNVEGSEQDATHVALNAEDGTLHLLRSGFLVAGIALLSLVLMRCLFGGMGAEGPRTAAGWLALMVTLMCMPFGLLLLLLGGAKWLRNQWLSRAPR